VSAVERARRALERSEAVGRGEVWISRFEDEEVLIAARRADARTSAGERLPLAGLTVAVKDNIDVAGLPTTAGCPAYAYEPDVDAPCVARLRAAGAVVLGKTNMDQFATGLVGTRSPYGAVRDARRPDHVSGGSSSGSAVAVATGCADLGLGTDTAGSGRVPAAFQGIVGLKPTRGLIPTAGVVPACRSFDCVSVFAPSLALAEGAMWAMADPGAWPADAPLAAPPVPRLGVLSDAELVAAGMSGAARAAYAAALERARALGLTTTEIDLAPFLEAGSLLYGGAFVSERHAAVGAFIAAHRPECDPVVAEIVLAAADVTASRYLADVERLDALRRRAGTALAALDALLLPTAPSQPRIAEVAADPVGVNARLGRFTTFANLLDLCAVAVPAGTADGGCFGVSLLAPAYADRVVADLARALAGAQEDLDTIAPPGIPLLVVGAHMSGGPLNGQLIERGARFAAPTCTSPAYRLFALDTDPPKPGLVRAPGAGASIAGELWTLPPAGLASLLAELPRPMALGRVTLEDGREVVGFLCEPAALDAAQEITRFGGWSAFLRAA
jgi:allophanate hydrolase